VTELGLVGRILEQKLSDHLHPTHLEVIDESNQHHGHAGAHPSGESHFRVRIASNAFKGLSRVAQHRLVNAAVAEELKTRVHALAVEVVG
jgi:BolA family transcriptional regulator, general stress-responsive regulator